VRGKNEKEKGNWGLKERMEKQGRKERIREKKKGIRGHEVRKMKKKGVERKKERRIGK
jgi:hypothetical protein